MKTIAERAKTAILPPNFSSWPQSMQRRYRRVLIEGAREPLERITAPQSDQCPNKSAALRSDWFR